MAPLARNNAFGPLSPSWNLAFPAGNLTAVEILAYLPHWLKSVDVIDRLVSNGGKAKAIAAIINEFRDQPKGTEFQANSVQIMMSYAMRRAGFKDWTVGKHSEWDRPDKRNESDLCVKDFRPPRLTHPKRKSHSEKLSRDITHNLQASPISFRDLAIHVKKHPFGPDALDLTRAVRYCMDHPEETWRFPTDFERLTHHLGGPIPITHSHLDRQAFYRREEAFFNPTKSTPKAPIVHLTPGSKSTTAHHKNMPTPLITRAISNALDLSVSDMRVMNSRKRKGIEGPSVEASPDAKRRSSRLVDKSFNFYEDSDEDSSATGLHESLRKTSHVAPVKTLKPSRVPPTPTSVSSESEFVDDISEPDEEISEDEEASDESVAPPTSRVSSRAAAHKASNSIQLSFVDAMPAISASTNNPLPLKKLEIAPGYMSTVVSPEIMNVVRTYSRRRPVFLGPPTLSADRLKVDEFSFSLYAAEWSITREEMWYTALSCYRFRGPRRCAPYRELHRLTDLHPRDTSDWAENIRWAKEQYKEFGSETWTEYDYHLEMITEHRREVMWVSEATIAAGM